MAHIAREILRSFVSERIVLFHQARLEALKRMNLEGVLRKKNPYLFRAKNFSLASELVAAVMNAYLSSAEEEIFGGFLEELALFVSKTTAGGIKSSAPGLDIEFERDGAVYLVAVKSRPNWGNSSQYAALERDFRNAITRQRQIHSGANVQAILGACYGRARPADKGLYRKLAGQSFWHFLSGDPDLYIDIVEPIGHQARQHNEDFAASRAAIENKFTQQFVAEFCDEGGAIDWPKLVAFNSGNLKL